MTVGLFTFEIGQFEVAPVMQSWSFGSGASQQRRQSDRRCVLPSPRRVTNPLRLAP